MGEILDETLPRIFPAILRICPGCISANFSSEHSKNLIGALHQFFEWFSCSESHKEGGLIIQQQKDVFFASKTNNVFFASLPKLEFRIYQFLNVGFEKTSGFWCEF